jgi:hypothetical protein
MPAPSTPEARNLHREAQALIEQAAVQHPESTASRIRQQGSAGDDGGAQGPEPSVHAGGAAERPANPGRTPTKERLLDTRGQARDGDARNVINARRTSKAEARAAAGYHPRRGGRYDSDEDRSPTPEPPGNPRVQPGDPHGDLPPAFRQPTTIVKYNGETDPCVCLNDYRLACHLGGATSDEVIIRNLPCTSPTQRGRGSSTCRPARSTTGTTWSARSWEISRARTCALGTPGTCALAPRSPTNRSGTSYDASPSAVRSSQAWHSLKSCPPSSRAPHAGILCASSSAARRSTRTSCSTSPPASP